jgi:uncharacterized membrane protein YhaH (DUF805 family)
VPVREPYWFPAKTYGWGWGPPITWQGWVVLIAWGAVLLEGLFLLRHHDHQLVVSLSYVLVMSVLLGVVCYLKGEPPKWRWGSDSE